MWTPGGGTDKWQTGNSNDRTSGYPITAKTVLKEPTDSFWRGLWRRVRSPAVDDAEIEARLTQLRSELPEPVFWLLGKAQSGKTSLVRALTGSSRAEIGNGFRPCTRTAQLYPFPDEAVHFVQFLDTRGLGEVDYDPTEDMRVLQEQAHCLIVVMRALDHAQRPVLDALETIHRAHPHWPIIVVQTCLHEGYPAAESQHILPYPYRETPFPPCVPTDLARSIMVQRQWFAEYEARFVAVDFTLPDDGFLPEHYGLDALWTAIEDVLPLGLRAMLEGQTRPLRDVYFRAAHPHVLSYAAVAGAAAGLPVPLLDIPLLAAVQAKLFHSVARIYGQPMTTQRAGEIASMLGVGFLARMGARELLKIIPGLGTVVAAAFAAASTYALGCTLCAYFSYVRNGDVPDAAALRKLYQAQYEEGRQRLGKFVGQIARGQEHRA